MNDTIIKVNTGKPYEIHIGKGNFQKTTSFIEQLGAPSTIAIVTDSHVDALYGDALLSQLHSLPAKIVKFVFPAGEESKTIQTYGTILSFLTQSGLTRSDLVVALGGGVVGDMAGFAAATYLRGIDFVQIPTTLLACIDSSVGGKTAVDLPEGKNLVGCFYQPRLVICDPTLLDTLPQEQWDCGRGELIKYAILDKKIFDAYQTGDLETLITLCIDYKRRIVEMDEFEHNERKLLNLGHTPAHSIEKLSDYTILHGVAVGMGVKLILDASLRHGFLKEADYNTINEAIGEYKQPSPYSLAEIAKEAVFDKKRSGDTISVVMIYGIGDCRIEKVKYSELEDYLSCK